MPGNESGTKNTIDRSLLVAVAEVLGQFSNADNDSVSMGEMRKRTFEKLPREGMLKANDYFKSSSDYIINEYVDDQ